MFGTRSSSPYLRAIVATAVALGVGWCFKRTSEHRRVEQALRAKDSELKLVADHTPVILSRCTRDMRFVWVNRAGAEFHGRTQEDFTGQRIDDVLGPTAFRAIKPHIAKVLQGEIVEFEAEIPYARTGKRVMHVCYMPEVNEAGEVTGWIASLSDLTTWRQAEQAVAERERMFRALVRASSQVVWRFRTAGSAKKEVDEASAAWWREFTGQSEAERTANGGTGWLEAVHPEDQQLALTCWHTVSSSDEPVESECRVRRRDGMWRWLAVTSVPIPDGNDGEESAGLVVDITERKEAELALRESEQKFRTVVEASTVPFSILEPVRNERGEITDFRWQYVNAAAMRLLQKPVEWLLGRRVAEDFPGAWEEPGLFEGYVSVVDKRRPFEMELCSKKSGRWLRIIATPLEGSVALWFADISERKWHERALQDADRRKDEFLATLAHELRNPLAPIRQAAHIARSERASDTQRQWAHSVIERQVKQMSLLLDDLLDVSRITRGTLSLRKKRVFLHTVVNAAVETARPLVESREHALHVEVPETLQITADPLRLSQVIGNLLTNAAKYTPHGGRIRLHAREQGGSINLCIEDTGIGLAQDDLQRIFEMFSQVGSSPHSVHGGLGIGLALSKGLIEMHGGSIEARSAGPGKGSQFIVSLPSGEGMTSVPERSAESERRSFVNRRVLIADDNRDAAESLAVLLRLQGHEVILADDGETALRLFEEQRPEVALIDIGMPQMDGYELTRQIRSRPEGKRTLLIAVTGWGQRKDRAASLEAGFDHHLVKPVETDVLARLIQPMR
jgi:PAS domain S-box-containing protein